MGVSAECDLKGKVIAITDGDTLKVLNNRRQYVIRLQGIDAPERKQDFGRKAKQALSGLAYGKEVCVLGKKKDRFGRLIGKVLVEGQDANKEMVAKGYAWHYKKYQSEQSRFDRESYDQVEKQASKNEEGLWSMPYQIAPWDYRKGKRKSVPDQDMSHPAIDSGSYQCSQKYCKQMVSCAEAVFLLTQCGLNRLDKDRDGVPCEKICR